MQQLSDSSDAVASRVALAMLIDQPSTAQPIPLPAQALLECSALPEDISPLVRICKHKKARKASPKSSPSPTSSSCSSPASSPSSQATTPPVSSLSPSMLSSTRTTSPLLNPMAPAKRPFNPKRPNQASPAVSTDDQNGVPVWHFFCNSFDPAPKKRKTSRGHVRVPQSTPMPPSPATISNLFPSCVLQSLAKLQNPVSLSTLNDKTRTITQAGTSSNTSDSGAQARTKLAVEMLCS